VRHLLRQRGVLSSCPNSFMAVGWHAKLPMSIYGSMRGDKGDVIGISASGEAAMLVCTAAH